MKKIIVIFICIISLYLLNTSEYNISDSEIRFRVIANSNSAYDILMKEKVVSKLSDILFIDSNNSDVIRENIYSNLSNIEKNIDELFKENNYDKTYNIRYGINEFPKKVFMGKTYKEGEYESLVIEIGEAKGNNYFCILYPSLCMIDYERKNDSNTNEYRFKIVDIIKDIF